MVFQLISDTVIFWLTYVNYQSLNYGAK